MSARDHHPAGTLLAAAIALVLVALATDCQLHNPVPCDPSPDCPCGPCGVVETVTKDAGRE